MNENNLSKRECLERLNALSQRIQASDEQDAAQLLREFVRAHDFHLVNEIGQLARDLHASLKACVQDARIPELAEHDIPDARLRLNHVIDMSEQATQRTLQAVEEILPYCKRQSTQLDTLRQDWQRYARRQTRTREFSHLQRDMENFFKQTENYITDIRERTLQILLAQECQDLGGQILQRVIALVGKVQDSLLSIIRLASQDGAWKPTIAPPEKIHLEGPQINAGLRTDVLKDQDEVDALLANLGF